MENWDCKKEKYTKTPEKLEKFFKEIEGVCKKHGYSIGHEDGHGSFEIQEFLESNIDWLMNAHFRLKGT